MENTYTASPETDPIYVIIVAAGTGSRFGADKPKQYCDLAGRPVLMHTIDAMRGALPEAQIAVVISEAMESLWLELCDRHGFDSPMTVYGGATRWESVGNALRALGITTETPGIVAVHDGARPLAPRDMTLRVINAVPGHDGAIPAVRVTDSLRVVLSDGGSKAVDRALYRAVQTPQGFKAGALAGAYALPYREEFTDDASVMTAAGLTDIVMVEGDERNIKITHPDDIRIAEIMAGDR
ncbi:MAG: 2-C-methyl-D-erythritol 4-phosphate cytidylyltransferase [Pseudoflavonifractor sp.]|nr:2-C-methyl-D-erythritol 4-phosphate cytidylyltransferase [Pseudoflavonifractor sp.]